MAVSVQRTEMFVEHTTGFVSMCMGQLLQCMPMMTDGRVAGYVNSGHN